MITLYGIKNCDAVKKARRWLDTHAIEYVFHDFREDGIEKQTAAQWITELGWETVVNRRSKSWKALAEAERAAMDDETAVAAVLAHPTLIKRPVLDTGAERHCGFSSERYREIFQKHAL